MSEETLPKPSAALPLALSILALLALLADNVTLISGDYRGVLVFVFVSAVVLFLAPLARVQRHGRRAAGSLVFWLVALWLALDFLRRAPAEFGGGGS